MQPKISIQIPTYNQAHFLPKTIGSCLAQDYPNIEINIADDNSTDHTAETVQPFLTDPRVKYYRNETNTGRVANYRKALYEYASGEWAINLDGDDHFTDPKFLSNAMSAITACRAPRPVIYQGNHELGKIRKWLPDAVLQTPDTLVVNGPDYFINYYKILQFRHCATLYKREEALKLNFYSFNSLFTDFNSVAKMFLSGTLLLSSARVAHWQEHADNASSSLNADKIMNELAAVDELAAFASRKLEAKKTERWRVKMKAYYLSVYLNLQKTPAQKRAALRLILRQFSPEKTHLRQLAKAFLGAAGLKKI